MIPPDSCRPSTHRLCAQINSSVPANFFRLFARHPPNWRRTNPDTGAAWVEWLFSEPEQQSMSDRDRSINGPQRHRLGNGDRFISRVVAHDPDLTSRNHTRD